MLDENLAPENPNIFKSKVSYSEYMILVYESETEKRNSLLTYPSGLGKRVVVRSTGFINGRGGVIMRCQTQGE